MFPECSCVCAFVRLFVQESQTNIVSKISWVFLMEFDQTFTTNRF